MGKSYTDRMKQKRVSQRLKKAPRSKMGRLYFAVTLCLVAFLVTSGVNFINEMAILKADRQQILQQIETEKKLQLTLASQKDYYKSDEYIEKIAREKLGLVKANDRVFIDRGSR